MAELDAADEALRATAEAAAAAEEVADAEMATGDSTTRFKGGRAHVFEGGADAARERYSVMTPRSGAKAAQVASIASLMGAIEKDEHDWTPGPTPRVHTLRKQPPLVTSASVTSHEGSGEATSAWSRRQLGAEDEVDLNAASTAALARASVATQADMTPSCCQEAKVHGHSHAREEQHGCGYG